MTDTTYSEMIRLSNRVTELTNDLSVSDDFLRLANKICAELKDRLAAVTAELESEKNINKILGSDVAWLRKSIDSLVDEIEQSRAECAALNLYKSLCDEYGLSIYVTMESLQSECERLRTAAKHAVQFISNGVELGYIKMPDQDTPDPAHNTLLMLKVAIAQQEKGDAT